jgi:glutaredoxin
VARSYGLYLEDEGKTDRATVIIDAGGVVRHASSVTPDGSRRIEDLAALCEAVDAEHGADLPPLGEPAGLGGATLYIKSRCGFSQRALNARVNLHLEDAIELKNISEDGAARARLQELTGEEQVPCLLVDGKPMLESDDIVRRLASLATDLS